MKAKDTAANAVIVDDLLSAEYHSMLCQELGIEVAGIATTPDGAEMMITDIAPTFVLMDVRLGTDRDGVDVAHSIYRAGLRPWVIYITGNGDSETVMRIITNHPHRVLVKPTRLEQLREAFESGFA